MTSLEAVLVESRALGFLGPVEVDTHVAQALAFAAAVDPPERFLDLGAGGGVPGLPLAVTWAQAIGMLLDAQARRVRFLAEAIGVLGLEGRVVARHGRAEEIARDDEHRGRFDVVVARSFGPPALTAECGAGFLTAGGVLLVAEPPVGGPERWPEDGLAALGLADDGVVRTAAGSVRRLRAAAAPLPTVPRRQAAMARRPAF